MFTVKFVPLELATVIFLFTEGAEEDIPINYFEVVVGMILESLCLVREL